MKKLILFLIAMTVIVGCVDESQMGTTAIVKESTSLCNVPNGKIIRDDIDRGRVVTVLKRQGSWVKIAIWAYDAPMDNVGWVKSSFLTKSKDGIELIEGRLKSELVLMDGPPPKGKRLNDKVGPYQLYIMKRENGWVHAQFAGGLDGWVPESSIEFIGPKI